MSEVVFVGEREYRHIKSCRRIAPELGTNKDWDALVERHMGGFSYSDDCYGEAFDEMQPEIGRIFEYRKFDDYADDIVSNLIDDIVEKAKEKHLNINMAGGLGGDMGGGFFVIETSEVDPDNIGLDERAEDFLDDYMFEPCSWIPLMKYPDLVINNVVVEDIWTCYYDEIIDLLSKDHLDQSKFDKYKERIDKAIRLEKWFAENH